MKLGETLVEGKHAPEEAVIYVIKNDDEVLYIGKSWDVEDRLAQHFDIESMLPTPESCCLSVGTGKLSLLNFHATFLT
jgi:hypothetical protein